MEEHVGSIEVFFFFFRLCIQIIVNMASIVKVHYQKHVQCILFLRSKQGIFQNHYELVEIELLAI